MIDKLGLGKDLPDLDEELKVEGIVRVKNLAKDRYNPEEKERISISFEFTDIEIKPKKMSKKDIAKSLYGKGDDD